LIHESFSFTRVFPRAVAVLVGCTGFIAEIATGCVLISYYHKILVQAMRLCDRLPKRSEAGIFAQKQKQPQSLAV